MPQMNKVLQPKTHSNEVHVDCSLVQTVVSIQTREVRACSLDALFWHRWSFGLPQVVVNGQRVHADRHGLGGDNGELLAVRAVLVEFVDHLFSDALGPCTGELVNLLRVGEIRVKGSKLAAAVTEQNHQVVGFTLLQDLKDK